MKKVSESFIMGAVALVFAILGYQTALLVHYSAVSSIVSHRDAPDTVYVHCPEGETVRVNSSHGPVTSAVRRKVPPRRAESFKFNPNTVSEEELVRLGFTAKQAASIVNYRNKGGRFRRKSDFAKSFVVSDSIYARLEKYIEIPLIDINKADSAAFDSLPGIGGWFAARMVEYRTRLGGYSFPEQLMEIYHFDEEKYNALKDLIFVGPGDGYDLWHYGEDSLRIHPYIGSARVARSIVFYRQNNPVSQWTVDALETAGVLNREQASKLKRCRIRNP